MAKLYVGNLPYTTSNQDLSDMFAQFGTVVSANIIMDRNTGKSKGFGFVELETDEQAQNAINALNSTQVGDRTIIVSIARPREDRPAGGGYQSRGAGGHGGDRDRRGGGHGGGGRGDWNDRRR